MNKNNMRAGLKLLLVSIVYRLLAFALFSASWEWTHVFIRIIEAGVGVLFLITWLIYGFKNKAGFKNGMIIGIVGASDALLLMVLSLVLFFNRGSYYIGPAEMMLWNIPLLGIFNSIKWTSNIKGYLAPLVAIFLTAFGSFIGKNAIKEN